MKDTWIRKQNISRIGLYKKTQNIQQFFEMTIFQSATMTLSATENIDRLLTVVSTFLKLNIYREPKRLNLISRQQKNRIG